MPLIAKEASVRTWNLGLVAVPAIAVLLVAACQDRAAPTDEAEDVLVRQVPAMSRTGCDPTTFSFAVCWWGHSNISVKVPESVLAWRYDQIISAADSWNYLMKGGVPGAPYLTVSRGVGGDVAVVFVPGAGDVFCGSADGVGQSYTISFYPAAHADCTGDALGSVEEVFLHEVAHVIGWEKAAEGVQYAGISDHCALHLKSDHTFNQQVCLHEVEGVFRAYREIGVPGDFWARGVLQHSNLGSAQINLQVGQTRQLQISSLFSDPPASYPLSHSVGPTNMALTSTSSTVASVSGSGLVTALAAGTTRIRVKGRQDQLPSNRLLWSPLEVKGDSVLVVVTADTILRVTNVTSPGAPPFTTSGNKALTAAIAGAAPSPAVQVTWQVDFSDNGPGWDVTQNGGTTFTLFVPGGSYSMSIKATPKQGGKTGAAFQSQWPVCTGGAGTLGLPQPNKPGGC